MKLDINVKNNQRKSENEFNKIREDISAMLRGVEKTQNRLREDMADKMTVERFEDAKKSLEQKILQFSNRIRENKIRFDPLLNEMHEMRRLKDQFMDHEDRYSEFQSNLQFKLV